jgi:hypothetical protein
MTFAEADLGPEIPVLTNIERRVMYVNHDRKMDDRMVGEEPQILAAGGCDSSGVPQAQRPGEKDTERQVSGDRAMTVKCDCGYFGPLDDCSHMACPWCGDRVETDRTEEGIRVRAAKRMAAKRAIEAIEKADGGVNGRNR